MRSVYRNIAFAIRFTINVGVLAFLLILYLFSGNGQFQHIHQLVHPHDSAEVHSRENESNPCHIAQYHPAESTGCEHTQHIAADDKCPWCILSFYADHLPVMFLANDQTPLFSELAISHHHLLVSNKTRLFSSRAPPAVV